jgi:hypothetical protein
MSFTVFSNSTRIEKIISSKDMFLRIFLCFMGLVFFGKKFEKREKNKQFLYVFYLFFSRKSSARFLSKDKNISRPDPQLSA